MSFIFPLSTEDNVPSPSEACEEYLGSPGHRPLWVSLSVALDPTLVVELIQHLKTILLGVDRAGALPSIPIVTFNFIASET